MKFPPFTVWDDPPFPALCRFAVCVCFCFGFLFYSPLPFVLVFFCFFPFSLLPFSQLSSFPFPLLVLPPAHPPFSTFVYFVLFCCFSPPPSLCAFLLVKCPPFTVLDDPPFPALCRFAVCVCPGSPSGPCCIQRYLHFSKNFGFFGFFGFCRGFWGYMLGHPLGFLGFLGFAEGFYL